jgi:predicted AAA+ superfamily ATPase
MIKRIIAEKIKQMAAKMPIISITGPRQSGKTTLAKAVFPKHTYVNLESPDVYEDAKSDPRSFLTQHKHGLIIDEAQKMPELFSYIQTISDENNKPGEFIITGSQNFLLSEKISQSLAGRVFITNLLPLSTAELKKTKHWKNNVNNAIFQGFYPRIYDKQIEPLDFYPSYIQTYTERDIRQIVNVTNLHAFQKFMRLAAGRIGQLLNYNNIANELGVDLKTVKSWFSILEAGFIIFFLQPHHNNYNKRLVKTPKLYFYDTGLACSLLGINDTESLNVHWAKGALFENLVIADIMKNKIHQVRNPSLFFWRDNTGNEIDLLEDMDGTVNIYEIKSSATVNNSFFKGLAYYKSLAGKEVKNMKLIYGGNRSYQRGDYEIRSWNSLNV